MDRLEPIPEVSDDREVAKDRVLPVYELENDGKRKQAGDHEEPYQPYHAAEARPRGVHGGPTRRRSSGWLRDGRPIYPVGMNITSIGTGT